MLALQRRGVGSAAIAATHGVSHNTIRTQIRPLYRKLGVTSRAEAVAVAERLSLLDDAAL
ncbi:LuxR C-terminal-related transcriptional regulator [Microbacterium sp. RU33B]|uniref:LuxR C-terminal-related transcriptional regulator n=1 Tax=Microbacterium sp. RU33B TaxID=1907390 RepID=UPI0009761333